MQVSREGKTNREAQSRRRAAGQDPAKRAQILDGAKRCFMSLGFEAASMNDITTEAGVSKGTLYVYFRDKEDLFKELIDREKSAVMGMARKELEKPGTIAEQLHRFGSYVTSRLTSPEIISAQRMVLGIAEQMPDVATRFFGGDAFSAHLILKDYLEQHVSGGELRIADTDLASRQFLELAMASVYKRRLFGNLPEPVPASQIDYVVANAVQMFLHHYATNGGTASPR
jgi:AcrR family transcriptional regulator